MKTDHERVVERVCMRMHAHTCACMCAHARVRACTHSLTQSLTYPPTHYLCGDEDDLPTFVAEYAGFGGTKYLPHLSRLSLPVRPGRSARAYARKQEWGGWVDSCLPLKRVLGPAERFNEHTPVVRVEPLRPCTIYTEVSRDAAGCCLAGGDGNLACAGR